MNKNSLYLNMVLFITLSSFTMDNNLTFKISATGMDGKRGRITLTQDSKIKIQRSEERDSKTWYLINAITTIYGKEKQWTCWIKKSNLDDFFNWRAKDGPDKINDFINRIKITKNKDEDGLIIIVDTNAKEHV